MASIATDTNGNVRIQFHAPDRKRKTIRLGKVPKKTAEAVRLRVEHLANALLTDETPVDPQTAAWVAGIGDDLAAKLAAVGLIPARQSAKLGDFLDAYITRRKSDAKPATILCLTTCRKDAVRFFGPDIDVRAVTEQKADELRTHYLTRTPKLASATVARRLKTVRLFFEHAGRMKLIDANPFRDVTVASTLPEERRHYVSAADTEKLIAAANPTWRIIIALSRYAGLRCPSEVLSLKWEHVNFETARMTVPSPKTEHHAGKAYRACPIFTALRPHLDEAFELAAPGAVCVVGGKQGDAYRATAQKPGGWNNTNMRTTFEKVVRRAGLKQWPRLFQALRASCETDLAAEHPFHVVTAWVGNTPFLTGRRVVADARSSTSSRRGSGTRRRSPWATTCKRSTPTLKRPSVEATRNPTRGQRKIRRRHRPSASDRERPNRRKSSPSREIRRSLSHRIQSCPNVQMAKVGLEPTRISTLDFESSASAIPPLGRSLSDF